MERDEVFVPKTRSQVFKGQEQAKAAAAAVADKQGESTFEALDEILEDAPLWNLFWVTMQQLLGWPMYLIRNASGQKYGRWTNREFILSSLVLLIQACLLACLQAVLLALKLMANYSTVRDTFDTDACYFILMINRLRSTLTHL